MQQENVIILKAYYGKQQGPLHLNPVKDLTTGKYKGVKYLNEQEKLTATKVVTGDTTRRISDGLVLDLNDKVDAIDWAWIKENKEIAPSEEDAKNNPQALFYIYAPDLALDKDLEKFDLSYEATKLVKEATPEERRDLCQYLGINVEFSRDKDVLGYLSDRVKSNPKSVLKAKEDPYFKDKLFLERLLNARLFRKDPNGTIKYGDIIVGLNQDAAISWINAAKNRALVGKLYGQIFGEAEEQSGSIVEEFESQKSEKKNKKAGTSGAAGKASGKKTEAEAAVGLEAEEEVL